jgi:hypothetical protein
MGEILVLRDHRNHQNWDGNRLRSSSWLRVRQFRRIRMGRRPAHPTSAALASFAWFAYFAVEGVDSRFRGNDRHGAEARQFVAVTLDAAQFFCW